MADKTINDLTSTSSLNDGDLFEIENTSNNSRKVAASVVAAYAVEKGNWEVAASWTYSSGVPNVDFANLGAYNHLIVIAKDLTTASSTDRFLRLSTDNGSTFHSSGYDLLSSAGAPSAGTVAASNNGSATAARSFIAEIPGSNIAGIPKVINTPHAAQTRIFTGSTDAINALRVAASTGNITGGSIVILGRK